MTINIYYFMVINYYTKRQIENMKSFTRRTFLVTCASLPLAACASYSGDN